MANQGVSILHCANWVVVCLVLAGGTMSSLRNGPAVSLWVEVSQLCLVMTWPWVTLSLDYSREEVPALSVSGSELTAEGVQRGFRGCEVPTRGSLFSVAS